MVTNGRLWGKERITFFDGLLIIGLIRGEDFVVLRLFGCFHPTAGFMYSLDTSGFFILFFAKGMG